MKKQILCLALLFFSVMHSMEQPKKRLLFPFHHDDVPDMWQLVREDWHAYHHAFKSLPEGVNQLIASFLLRLKNPRSFSTSQDQFFRKLLGCCVMIGWKTKEWKFPFENAMQKTCDGNYCVYWEDGINVYDVQADKLIKFLPSQKNTDYIFSPERNAILQRGFKPAGTLSNYLLYDIVHDTWIDFGKWFRECISPTKKYIWRFDKELIHIWNIADLNNITHHTLEHNDEKNHFLKFSSDDTYIIMGTRYGSIVLLKEEEDSTLKECFCYSCHEFISGMECVHHDENDYLVAYVKDQDRSLGMKIEKSEEGIVSLRKSFDVPKKIEKLVGNNGFGQFSYPQTYVFDCLGNLCSNREVQEVTTSIIRMGKCHTCYQVREGLFDTRVLIIRYPECDDQNNFKRFARIKMTDVSDCPYIISSNGQTFWCTKFVHRRGTHCLDFHGKKILSFSHPSKGYMSFHSNGRALLYQNYDSDNMKKGEIKKKYVLHPKGADAHLNKLVHGSLTIAQYYALEKLCEKVEEVRNKNLLNAF